MFTALNAIALAKKEPLLEVFGYSKAGSAIPPYNSPVIACHSEWSEESNYRPIAISLLDSSPHLRDQNDRSDWAQARESNFSSAVLIAWENSSGVAAVIKASRFAGLLRILTSELTHIR